MEGENESRWSFLNFFDAARQKKISSTCDKNKTHHLDGLPGIETVVSMLAGEGKKKTKLRIFVGGLCGGLRLALAASTPEVRLATSGEVY